MSDLIQRLTNVADGGGNPTPVSVRELCNEAAAELTKLRTVYAAAVQECRMARAALGHDTALSLRHDTARDEAGMEAGL